MGTYGQHNFGVIARTAIVSLTDAANGFRTVDAYTDDIISGAISEGELREA